MTAQCMSLSVPLKVIINSLTASQQIAFKKEIIDKMQEVQKMMDEKDSENKKFIRDVLTIAGVVIVTVAGTAISLLGGDSKLKLPNSKE